MNHLKEQFLIDPDIIFLNHGSFGAAPRPVFDMYQEWQHRLERQPVLFLGRELDSLLDNSRRELGKYLRADPDDLIYIPNATHGVNILARSMDLKPGDQVLTTDHEYGACDNTWDYLCKKSGAVYIHQPIPLPVQSPEEITEDFWEGVTSRTRVIYLSHITSPTALRLPVEQICTRAREAGITTIVDAAHSPGQIKLNIQQLNADFVFGNCHKWMLSPKGAGFLYSRKELQSRVEPLVVSWGYNTNSSHHDASRYIELFQWTGTHDPAAALSVPSALQFMAENDWGKVRTDCHALLKFALERIVELTGLPPLYPLDSDFYSQMGIAPLPPHLDPITLKKRLYDEYKIEIPIIQWQDRLLARLSVQGYNSSSDIDSLLEALSDLLIT